MFIGLWYHQQTNVMSKFILFLTLYTVRGVHFCCFGYEKRILWTTSVGQTCIWAVCSFKNLTGMVSIKWKDLEKMDGRRKIAVKLDQLVVTEKVSK